MLAASRYDRGVVHAREQAAPAQRRRLFVALWVLVIIIGGTDTPSLDGNIWVASNAALGALGAAGWLLGSERVHGWLGWAALVFGIALFIPFADFIALLLSLVWIVVASIAIYREPDTERQAAVVPA